MQHKAQQPVLRKTKLELLNMLTLREAEAVGFGEHCLQEEEHCDVFFFPPLERQWYRSLE